MPPYFLIISTSCAFLFLLSGITVRRSILPSLQLLIIDAGLSITMDYASYYIGVPVRLFVNIYALVYFYLQLFSTRDLLSPKLRRSLYWTCGTLYFVVWIWQLVFFGSQAYVTIALPASSILISIAFLTTLFYKEFYDRSQNIRAIRLLCLAIVLYAAGTLPVFSQFNLWANKVLPSAVMDINTALDALKYLLLTFSFYYFSRSAGKTYLAPAHGK